MMSECVSPTWMEKPTRLKFALGGFLLFGARFKAVVSVGYYGDFGTDPGEPPTPLDHYASDVRCALVNSHPIEGPLPRIALAGKYIRYVPAQYRRFYVSLTGEFQDYVRHLSSKRRKHLRQALKRFGEIQWREYRHPREMSEFYEIARGISRKTYQENMVDAGLPDTQAFRDQLNDRAERDEVCGYLLFHEGKPVAYQYCRAEGSCVILCEKVGYDPEYGDLSPGTVLLYLIVERMFAQRRFERFDFGRGEFPYKETFSTGWSRCGDIYHFRRTVANYTLVFGHTALDLTWAAVAGTLDKIGLRKPLKQLVRRHYVKR